MYLRYHLGDAPSPNPRKLEFDLLLQFYKNSHLNTRIIIFPDDVQLKYTQPTTDKNIPYVENIKILYKSTYPSYPRYQHLSTCLITQSYEIRISPSTAILWKFSLGESPSTPSTFKSHKKIFYTNLCAPSNQKSSSIDLCCLSILGNKIRICELRCNFAKLSDEVRSRCKSLHNVQKTGWRVYRGIRTTVRKLQWIAVVAHGFRVGRWRSQDAPRGGTSRVWQHVNEAETKESLGPEAESPLCHGTPGGWWRHELSSRVKRSPMIFR